MEVLVRTKNEEVIAHSGLRDSAQDGQKEASVSVDGL